MGENTGFGNELSTELVEDSSNMLDKTRKELDFDSISMPIAKISTLGSGVASLIPAFNSGTATTKTAAKCLYKVVNNYSNEELKAAKNGDYWGAFKNADGKSVMARFKPVDDVTSTTKVAMKANPATIMMAVALYSVEKELGQIEEMEKQIIEFLESEKQAEIEGDVITLNEMLSKYKHNWDNDQFVNSNHKLVCDIQRTARKNIIFYRKAVEEGMKENKILVSDGKLNSKLQDLQKKFQYYRLSLYSYSLASLSEIMLSGNFGEGYIKEVVQEVEKYSDEYLKLYEGCSQFIEKLSDKSIGINLKKGVGNASKSLGKLIGNIPKVKEGKIDTFLLEKGDSIKDSALEISLDVIKSFEVVKDPGVGIFTQKMREMEFIYNHASEIRMDEENIYMIA